MRGLPPGTVINKKGEREREGRVSALPLISMQVKVKLELSPKDNLVSFSNDY